MAKKRHRVRFFYTQAKWFCCRISFICCWKLWVYFFSFVMFIVSIHYLRRKKAYGVQKMAFYFCDITWQIPKWRYEMKKMKKKHKQKQWRLYKNRTEKKFYFLLISWTFYLSRQNLSVCLLVRNFLFFSSLSPIFIWLFNLCLV